MPKVSIVTASYNYEDYIKETIQSVLNQTFSDWEMIIIDDGSKDNSVSVIQDYCNKDERIKLFLHENGENKGIAETVKLGIKKASSDWIIFLESDDTIEQNYIEEKLKIVEKYPEITFIFNDINMFGDADAINEYLGYFQKQKRILNKIKFPSNLLKTFRKTHTNLIPTFSCVMVKKSSFENIDFNSPIKKGLDKYLWMQMAKKNVFYYVDTKLTNWRMHKSSYVNTGAIDNHSMFEFEYKRTTFLYSKYSYIRILMLWIDFLRKNVIKIHVCGNEKEIILFGKKII